MNEGTSTEVNRDTNRDIASRLFVGPSCYHLPSGAFPAPEEAFRPCLRISVPRSPNFTGKRYADGCLISAQLALPVRRIHEGLFHASRQISRHFGGIGNTDAEQAESPAAYPAKMARLLERKYRHLAVT